jgi:hypothetical protein
MNDVQYWNPSKIDAGSPAVRQVVETGNGAAPIA